jgi:hypothetical protein
MYVIDPEANVRYELRFEYDLEPGLVNTDGGRIITVNGTTIAILIDQTDGEEKFWAEAYCSMYDTFDRTKGRVVALRRLGDQLPVSFRKAMWKAVADSGMKLGKVPQ